MATATNLISSSYPGESLTLTINKTWDGLLSKDESEIHIKLFMQGESDFVIQVDAPFFNDPQLPTLLSPPQSKPQLWDYEVVEVFFLGDDDKYLEVELAPHGHYLLLELHGSRNIVNESFKLDHYVTEIRGNRWFGEAFIPLHYIPPNPKSLNAYAIHKSDPERVYMALFPAVDYNNGGGESCQHEYPDFHRLQYFQQFNLPELCKAKRKLGN